MKLIALIVMIVYFIALLSTSPTFLYRKYLPNPWQLRFHFGPYWICELNSSKMIILGLLIKDALLIGVIPLPILIMLHIATYRAIMKSSQQFQLDANRMRTLKRVRKTFFVVIITFFSLTFPPCIYFLSVHCMINFKPSMLYYKEHILVPLTRFFNILVSLNSVVNPLIYSKIHRRFSGVRCCARRRASEGRHSNTAQTYVVELQRVSR